MNRSRFGANASLESDGTVVGFSANYIKLTDGGHFDATNPAASVLTVASSAAFRFIGPTTAPITVQGSDLVVPEGVASRWWVGG